MLLIHILNSIISGQVKERSREMNRLFSVDDIADHFRSPVAQSAVQEESSASSASKMMNRSASEWEFQRFLQEVSELGSSPPPSSSKPVTVDNDDVDEIKNNCNPSTAAAAFAAGPPNVPIDSEEHQAYLRSRLDLACAAVALTRASSLRELSDDGELQGETETTRNMDPADAKRVRRMLSNRESARRSRKRKEAHLTELEAQVSELGVENSSLVKRLTDITQMFNEAAVENRVLKADVETLRAKVKMAQETFKRVTGSKALFQAMSEISTIGMTTSFYGSTSAVVPVQDDPKQHFYQPAPNNHTPTHDQSSLLQISALDNIQHNPATTPVDGNKIGRTPSMQQRVARLEHLQKRICGGISSCRTQCSGEQ